MGCIVNGPGEMADADFGYVGGAPGKIDLYVGKEVVRRAIPMSGATDELIELIKVRQPAFACCMMRSLVCLYGNDHAGQQVVCRKLGLGRDQSSGA